MTFVILFLPHPAEEGSRAASVGTWPPARVNPAQLYFLMFPGYYLALVKLSEESREVKKGVSIISLPFCPSLMWRYITNFSFCGHMNF